MKEIRGEDIVWCSIVGYLSVSILAGIVLAISYLAQH